jgi:hypothetical protein
VGTFDEVRVAVREDAANRVKTAAARMTEDLKREAPVVTGELQRKTGVEFTGETRSEVRAEAVIDVTYAEFVTMGTRPHIIKARNKQALAFNWPKAGGTVIVKSVMHPGTQANEFFQRIVDRWGTYLNSTQ